MPNRVDRFLGALGLQRSFNPFTPAEWQALAQGSGYYPQFTQNNKQEPIGQGYTSLVVQAYAQNPIVFACENARVQLFSEARFQFQKMVNGRPGELHSTPATYLSRLEHPAPGVTTSQMLKTMLLDADFAGNGLIARRPTMYQRMRPDWTVIISGNPRKDANPWDLDSELLGYGYQPGGPQGGQPMEILHPSEVGHFRSTPDPLSRFSGMPWLLPVLREIAADGAATGHKVNFWENAATPNLIIKFAETMTSAQAKDWVELFNKDHTGSANAFKTLFLGGGASADAIGANMRQAAMTEVQGAGELRIASAAGVPPIIVGLAGGLEAATYSNYGQARRAFSDLTMRPLWRDMAGALASIVTVPAESRLWYDDRDISFLQEDMKDAAEIQSTQAAAMRQLVDAGFEPGSVVEAVTANDMKRLRHTNLYSVQLQPPMPEGPPKQIEPINVTPEKPAIEPPKKMLMNSAERELIAEGVLDPTVAQIAERIGVSDRTLRRWKADMASADVREMSAA